MFFVSLLFIRRLITSYLIEQMFLPEASTSFEKLVGLEEDKKGIVTIHRKTLIRI